MISRIRYICPEGTVPQENLAIEEYLMRHVADGECVLSLWRSRQTVVVGRNQNIRRECRVDQLLADGGQIARRLSGGGAVYHDLGNLNFSFMVSDPDYDVDRQLSVIAEALKEFGLNAEKTGRNDVTVDGRKCSGNAFLQEGRGHCHHGTLLISVSSADMAKYLTPDPGKLKSKGVASVKSRVVNLQDLAPELTVDTVKPALIRAFGKVYGLEPEELPMSALDWDVVRARTAELKSAEWLYGHDPACSMRSQRQYFPWGSGELVIDARKGKVAQATLYTDALDENLSAKVSATLEGVSCDRQSLLTALSQGDWNPAVSEGLGQLIAQML